MFKQTDNGLPLIIVGPLLRRLTPDQLVLWLVTSVPLQGRLECCYPNGERLLEATLGPDCLQSLRIGDHAWVNLITLRPEPVLPRDCLIQYDLWLAYRGEEHSLVSCLPELVYPCEQRPSFVIKSHLDNLLHGSCRKPHYPSGDGLAAADRLLAEAPQDARQRPALLMMSGDQIYADDVAGPMLSAIHQTIALLGLYPELLSGARVADSDQLYASAHCYYEREQLLPSTKVAAALQELFFSGVRKPIFTADTAHNHLITLAEVLAMYLLVWSPSLWQHIHLRADRMAPRHQDLFLAEQREIEAFAGQLAAVQRLLAHLPSYMIFDDHDVTDDWNLTAGWERAAYEHPFSRRIIGNALIGYWLCQGWGNAPDSFTDAVIPCAQAYFEVPTASHQDRLIDRLLAFEQWHYTVPTSPKMVVLDTRTHRWWSESSEAKPSGLMDWEALSDLQQALIGEEKVVLVSPAPIFGVKLIESIQRVFSYCGRALMVDAENWMAHPGAANVILNIFLHPRTPRHFVILSGDVHYSFVYDVLIRFRRNSPRIWQITCSGLKNEFPQGLLRWLDRLNRWVFASRSPLNWFTKRRRMRILTRSPLGQGRQQLVNRSGIGRVWLDEAGVPTRVVQLGCDGTALEFAPSRKAERRTEAVQELR